MVSDQETWPEGICVIRKGPICNAAVVGSSIATEACHGVEKNRGREIACVERLFPVTAKFKNTQNFSDKGVDLRLSAYVSTLGLEKIFMGVHEIAMIGQESSHAVGC